MSVRATVLSHIDKIRDGGKASGLPLTDDLALLETGLDSLDLAILVTRLEDELGFDPFTDTELRSPPATLGEFIRLYQHVARSD